MVGAAGASYFCTVEFRDIYLNTNDFASFATNNYGLSVWNIKYLLFETQNVYLYKH